MKLLTNNPKKIVGLEGYGLEVVERVPIEMAPTRRNRAYLATKRDKMGHLLTLLAPPAVPEGARAPAATGAKRAKAARATRARKGRNGR
jgi:3,4-dihydroxy 2-butanone 4-phosphate synthase/GTP cyclohydrolase II